MPVRGGGRCIVGNHFGKFKPGEIIFSGAGLPHVFYTLHKGGHPSGCEFYKIHFPASLTKNLAQVFPEAAGLESFFRRAGLGISFSGDTRRAFDLMRRIFAASSTDVVSCIGLFLEFLSELQRNPSSEILSPGGSVGRGSGFDVERLRRICDYLHRHFLEHVRLKEVAEHAGMSIPNLCAFFKKSTNTSVIDYVNRLRIERACNLISDSDDKISVVAGSCGYRTLSHFNREFRKFKGMEPRAFKRLDAMRSGRER